MTDDNFEPALGELMIRAIYAEWSFNQADVPVLEFARAIEKAAVLTVCEERDQLRQQVESLKAYQRHERSISQEPLLAKEIDHQRENAHLHELCEQQAARIAELEKDAARYRWLRAALSDRTKRGVSHHFCSIPDGKPNELDDAIDAALAQQVRTK